MEIKDLEQIIGILRKNDVTEFELEHNGTHIRLSRSTRASAQIVNLSTAPVVSGDLEPAIIGSAPAPAQVDGKRSAEFDNNMVKVESPIVGTFYRRPNPDAEPFVKEGEVVKKGDTLCIVEAMKLMNEIEAPSSGRIERALPNDGQVVEFGEILFLINPNV